MTSPNKVGLNINEVFRNPAVTLASTSAPVLNANLRKRARDDNASSDGARVANRRPNPGPSASLSGRIAEPSPSQQQYQHNHQHQNFHQIPVSTRTPSASDTRGPRKLSEPVPKQGHETSPPLYTTQPTNAGPEMIASVPIPNSNNVANQIAIMGMGIGMGMGSFPGAQMFEARGLRNGYGRGLSSGGSPYGINQVGNGPTFNAPADRKPLVGPNDVRTGLRSFNNNGTIGPGTNGPSMSRHPNRGHMGNQTGVNGGTMGFALRNNLDYIHFMGNAALYGNTLGLDNNYLSEITYLTNNWNRIPGNNFNATLAAHNMQNNFFFPPGNHRTRSNSNRVAQSVPQQQPSQEEVDF